MRDISKSFALLMGDNKGASAVEYAVLLTLISAVIILTVGLLGVESRNAFNIFNVTLADSVATERVDKCGDKDSADDQNCGIGNDRD